MAKVRQHINRTRWTQEKLEARTGLARRSAETVRRYTREEIARSGRNRTGRMSKSVYVRNTRGYSNEATTWAVGSSLNYFTYQNQGFGPVRAKRAKALRIPLRNGTVIFRKFTTRPVEPGHFIQKAMARFKARPGR